MISAESFQTTSLRAAAQGEAITRILVEAIRAVDPREAVKRAVRLENDALTVSGRAYDLQSFERIALLGIGKASVAMAQALAGILGNRLSQGLAVTKHDLPITDLHPRFSVQYGGHPVPDERSIQAGENVVEFLSRLGPADLLICLLSGGGSALVMAPVEGVSLADLKTLTRSLLTCGASINEINTLRRRLDRLKGGGVVRLANQAQVISLILSDVVGNPLEAIASGPTAPDPDTRAEALAVIGKYGLRDELPPSVIRILEAGSELSKPSARLFERVQNVIIGSVLTAAQAGLKQAAQEGFHPYLLRIDLQGEARQAGFELATFLRQTTQTGSPVPAPACIIAGGETTVTVRGKGRGGRTTELALAAVSELAGYPGVMLITLATDGEDGPTDAAGAVVTSESFRRAAALGMDPGGFLAQNDSYSFFEALDDLLKPGPTGTNVDDLVFMFIL